MITDEQREMLQLVHDIQCQFADNIEGNPSEEFKKGWFAAVETLTKYLMGIIVGAHQLPSKEEVEIDAIDKLLKIYKSDNENVHLCDNNLSSASHPYKCQKCGKEVNGVGQEVIDAFEKRKAEINERDNKKETDKDNSSV